MMKPKSFQVTDRAFPRSAGRVVCSLVLSCLAAASAHADWLVTRDGERIETQGGWEIRGRMVVFEQHNGTLSSIRLSVVDLDASAEATRKAAAAATPAPEEPAQKRPAKLVITTADVGEGTPGAEGPDLLIERLRQAHSYGDVSLAMGLVNWQDVPAGMKAYIETRFDWMMQRKIRSVRFIAAEPDEVDIQAIQDDVLYEPNVEVAGRMVIQFIPDPDQDELSLTFQVGTRLGSYFIAAPREVPD